jgi:2-C-methyl-D-erythritol 4-phosphate cytidylyltransferase
MKIVAVLLAAGKGSRTKNKEPKQILKINNKMLFQYALEPLLESYPYEKIVIVSTYKISSIIENIIKKKYRKYPIEIILGGETRQESIRKALTFLSKGNYDLALFQDAARPFVKKDDYTSVISQCSNKKYDGAIIVEPVRGLVVSPKEKTVDKINKIGQYLTHMPECYKIKILKMLYEKPRTTSNENLTNLETMITNGKKIALVISNNVNIKVTFPEDVTFLKKHL